MFGFIWHIIKHLIARLCCGLFGFTAKSRVAESSAAASLQATNFVAFKVEISKLLLLVNVPLAAIKNAHTLVPDGVSDASPLEASTLTHANMYTTFLNWIKVTKVTKTLVRSFIPNTFSSDNLPSSWLTDTDDHFATFARSLMPDGKITTAAFENPYVRFFIFIAALFRTRERAANYNPILTRRSAMKCLTIAAAVVILASIVDTFTKHGLDSISVTGAMYFASSCTSYFTSPLRYILSFMSAPMIRKIEDSMCALSLRSIIASAGPSTLGLRCLINGTTPVCEGLACTSQVEECTIEHYLTFLRAANNDQGYRMSKSEAQTPIYTIWLTTTAGSWLPFLAPSCEVLDTLWSTTAQGVKLPLRTTWTLLTIFERHLRAAAFILAFCGLYHVHTYFSAPRRASAALVSAATVSSDVLYVHRTRGSQAKTTASKEATNAWIEEAAGTHATGTSPSRITNWLRSLDRVLRTTAASGIKQVFYKLLAEPDTTAAPFYHFAAAWPNAPWDGTRKVWKVKQPPPKFDLAVKAGVQNGDGVVDKYLHCIDVGLALLHISAGTESYSAAEAVHDALMHVKWRATILAGGDLTKMHSVLITIVDIYAQTDHDMAASDASVSIDLDDLIGVKAEVRTIKTAADAAHKDPKLFDALRGSTKSGRRGG